MKSKPDMLMVVVVLFALGVFASGVGLSALL
jgi:hypothetical protein